MFIALKIFGIYELIQKQNRNKRNRSNEGVCGKRVNSEEC